MTAPQQAAKNGASAEAAAPAGTILDKVLAATSTRTDVEALLRKGQTYDEITTAVRMAARDNPEILKCTPRSIRQAVSRAVQMGLEIGVTVFLVPYKNILTPIASYHGLIELMRGSGAVRNIEVPRVVYEGEHFDEQLGSERRLIHAPDYGKRAPGKIVGAYVFYRLPLCERDWLFLPIAAIEERRAKSQKWNKSKIKDCPEWYAKKSVIRELAKYMPHNPKLRAFFLAVGAEEEVEGGELLDLIANEHDAMVTPASEEAGNAADEAAALTAGEPFDPETGEVLEPEPQDDTWLVES